MANINWNTVPNYDEWGFDSKWGCEEWIEYHKALKNRFGKDKAKYVWDYAFAQGSEFSEHWNCRSFNSDFRKYVQKYDLDPYKNTWSFIKGIGMATDVVSGVIDTASFVTRNTKTILIVGLIGVATFYGFKAYKSLK